jgi:Cu(I)/Ag(I) efflux system membrane fusion protein
MYATVDIAVDAAAAPVVVVPDSAVLDSGTRQVVLLERGAGRYEPRVVTTGARADGDVEIRSGVAAGDKVVVGANFLIDAESNLRAALQSFTAARTGPEQPR